MNLLLYIFSTLFLCQFYTLLLIDPVTHCRCIASGGPSSLWLPAAEEHADKDPYARPQRGYAGNALRKLQSPVHPEHDAHGGAGEELQVSGVRMHTDAVWLFVWLVGWLNTPLTFLHEGNPCSTCAHWCQICSGVIEMDVHTDRVVLCMCVGVNMGFSVHETYREVSEADFLLPLAAVGTKEERHIFKKDEEVRLSYLLNHLFTESQSSFIYSPQ